MAKILVIDDEADMRFILTECLTRDGHTIDSAENGKAGMSLAKLTAYDLVITDMIMPEMDGIEVIAKVRATSPSTKIIALTGGSSRIDKSLMLSTASAMRADRVLAKPLDVRVLRAVVNEVLAV